VAGRERRFGEETLVPAETPATWLVAGGGPAGLKAAETLARRGHDVTLVEREELLGGQVNLILKTPGRDEFGWITRDLEVQLQRLGVDVRLGVEATPELVREFAPDGVIVATGAVPSRSGFSSVNPLVDHLPGAEQDNVLTVWDVLNETRPAGQRVVVLDDDGTRYAAGVTEVLLDRGCQVELVSRWPALFPSTLTTLDMAHLYGRLLGKGLAYRLNSWALGIDGGAVTVFNLYTGAQETLDGVDTVVLATGPKANDDLYLALKGEIANVHRIGDCLAPRKLDHAIYEGYLAGRELWSPEERYIYEGELERLEATVEV
jgi:NADPH-dependent 2,4-dienoyl-CoA reductase/sulfur reductase-like enzyme